MYEKEYRALTLRLGFAVLLMFLLLQGLMTLLGVSQLLFEAFLNEKAANVLYWGLYNVFYFASFVLPVPFFALISRKISTQPMCFDVRFPKHFWLMATAAVGIIMAVGQINSLLTSPFAGDNSSSDVLLDLIVPDKGYMVVLVFVMIVIVPPFCEEFLFRGLVLGNLLPYGKGVAIVGSALLFGAMHQNFSQFLYTTAAGILLGYLYVESRSIWPSTLVHMLNNLLSFAQMMVISRVQDEMMANRIAICMNLLAIFAGLGAAVLLVLIKKREKPTKEPLVSAFGVSLDEGKAVQHKPLGDGVAVRSFFSPSVAVFICLCLVMAVFNLIVENML